MKLKSWIFCCYGSPTAINHPKTNPNIDKSTFKCTQCNKTDPTSLDIPQFQSNDSWYDQKTMRNRGFEPWTFRSCLDYHHFVINDNNRDQRKKDSKKTSTTTIAEIKTKANVVEKAFALVAAIDHGDNSIPFMVIHSDVWGPSKVPTLSGSRWFVTFIDDCTRMTWLCLMKTKDEVNLLFQNFHKMIETQYNAKWSTIWVQDVSTEIPNQSSAEGVLNLEPDPFMKRLPHHHNRALSDPRWKATMNEEMKSLQKNETWELVECPRKEAIGCRWIYL
ncbi:hypothetical protein AAG906_010615 [Vitis piasezkii]